MENQQLVSNSRQCSITPVGFGEGFLSKVQRGNTAVSLIRPCSAFSWFLPVPSTEISVEGTAILWCYWHNYECNGRAEKVFIKWLPGMFPTPLQSLAEVYSCTRGLFWIVVESDQGDTKNISSYKEWELQKSAHNHITRFFIECSFGHIPFGLSINETWICWSVLQRISSTNFKVAFYSFSGIIINFTIILHPLFVMRGLSPFYCFCEPVFLPDVGWNRHWKHVAKLNKIRIQDLLLVLFGKWNNTYLSF